MISFDAGMIYWVRLLLEFICFLDGRPEAFEKRVFKCFF